MWLSLHDALPTETFRFKRHLASSDMCKRCNKVQETMEHCLRDCERSKAIWYMLDPSILDSTAGTALEEWFRKALANNEASFGAGLWWVWRHRCNDIFNTDNPWTDHKVVALARITAKDLQVYRNRSNAFRDSKGDWISGCSGSIPPWSIIRCELFAAWRGLVLAWDCGLRDIICETDCLDILPIMHELTSGYSSEVTDLVHKIQELLSRPWLVHVEWVSRKANRAADWMAKYGAKSNSNHVIWSEPGVDLQRIIRSDLG
ncbi:Putative ribonuclease H protein [Arachis hypogaea]|nr:Putative ribonuclease H protein [Arachis hypogaea]